LIPKTKQKEKAIEQLHETHIKIARATKNDQKHNSELQYEKNRQNKMAE